MNKLLLENIRIALNSIRSQLLRTVLTALIIAIGITALVGILSAIDAIKGSISSNFTRMGANTFTIRNRETTIRIGREGKNPKNYEAINYRQVLDFKERYNFPAQTSVSTLASFASTLKYGSEKTNPNIRVFGSDENYVSTAGYEIAKGRNFSPQEINMGNHVAIIGNAVAQTLFKKKQNPIDKVISIGNGKYKVIGVLKEKGNTMGMGGDKIGIIPIPNARQYFAYPNMSFTINVVAPSPERMEDAINEAVGVMRIVKKLNAGQENNFEIVKSDALANTLIENLQTVTMGATIIGLVTLLGAAIGLMNIMLVSVTERTREIGTRKALGASAKTIKWQFLIEAVVICQIGGLAGILLGIVIGNVTSFSLGTGFMIPWFWVITGILTCMIVGLLSGLIPATRAAKLDPIEALRHE